MVTSPFAAFKSLFGSEFGLGALGELATKLGGTIRRITNPVVTATISVAAEITDVRIATITLKDRKGNAVAENTVVDLLVLKGSDTADFATTGGSTGIAASTAGKVLTIVAKKLFKVISKNDGTIVVTWTDTGTESVAIGIRLPNGNMVIGTPFANA